MSIESLEVKKLDPEAVLPVRAHHDDAGLDLYGLEDVILKPGEGRAARTGIALAIPAGHVGLVADRSSMAKKGVKTAGGVIDAGYRGEIKIVVWNISQEEVRLTRGDRIAQLLILPIATPMPREVGEFSQADTTRGDGGFGSTGR